MHLKIHFFVPLFFWKDRNIKCPWISCISDLNVSFFFCCRSFWFYENIFCFLLFLFHILSWQRLFFCTFATQMIFNYYCSLNITYFHRLRIEDISRSFVLTIWYWLFLFNYGLNLIHLFCTQSLTISIRL